MSPAIAPREPAAGYGAALRRIGPALALAGVFSAAVNLLMLTGPLYMLQVYDRVLASGSASTLAALFGIVVVLYVFLGLYSFLRARILSRAAYRLDAAMALPAFRRAMAAAAPAGPGAGAASGGGGEEALRDLGTVRAFLGSPAMAGLFDLPWIPLFLAIVFLIHPWLGALTAGGALVVLALAVANQLASRRGIALWSGLEGAQGVFAQASRRGAGTVAAMGMSSAVEARWQALHDGALSATQLGGDRGEGFAAASKAFRLLLQSALLTLGAYLAIRQEISAGMIIATSIIAGRALAPVDQVIGAWPTMGRALAAHRSLRAAFPEPVAGQAIAAAEAASLALPAPSGPLVLSGVTCRAPGAGSGAETAPILDAVSFVLEPGDGLGVIGPSAAGKSSLARVLVGAWRPDSGELRLDGARLDQWPAALRGRHVGYLPQQVEMLPGTIAENIARFDPTRADEEIVEAARLAGVHDMILRLPQGYATPLGGPGAALSGGQVQRLGLARAVIGRPALVVLDEPNANLDGAGDAALAAAIVSLRASGSIVVVMAHRPSALAAVNRILILQGGRILRFGSKEEVVVPAPVPAEPAPPPSTGPAVMPMPAAGGTR